MKIRNQKRLIFILGGAFLVLLIAWFAFLKPLTTVEENKDVELDLLEGEVPITSRLTNFYIFAPIEDRSGIQSIDVENEFGGYRVYRDAADAFQLEGFPGLSFNQELFSSLVVTTSKPTAMMRVGQDLDEAGLAEYGLDHPQASWTVTSTTGEKYKIFVGDELLTEGGYYVSYEGRPGAAYIMSQTLADTILQPAYKLLSPLLTAGLSTNTYFFVDEFTVMHGEDLFVHITRLKPEQQKNPDAIVEVKLTWPRPENTANGEVYDINDDLYFQILYNFMALEGEEVVAFMPTDEELEYAVVNIEEQHRRVDLIIPHVAPASVKRLIDRNAYINDLNIFLDTVMHNTRYQKWYFGSLHEDRPLSDQLICVFEEVYSFN